MGVLLLVLIIGALVAVIWGRGAAQSLLGLVGCMAWLAFVVVTGLVLYALSPGIFRQLIIFLAVAFIVVVLFNFREDIAFAFAQKKSQEVETQRRQIEQQRQNGIAQQLTNLGTALKEKNPSKCLEICDALRKADEAWRTLPMLEIAINDLDEEVRFCAVVGLSLGYSYKETTAKFQGQPTRNSTSTAEFKARATQLLCRALEDPNETSKIRRNAASALGVAGYGDGLGTLLKNITNIDDGIRLCVCGALKEFGLQDLPVGNGLPLLIAALMDKSAEVRFNSAKALGAIGDPQALRHLQRVQLDANEQADVRQAAGEAVESIRKKRELAR